MPSTRRPGASGVAIGLVAMMLLGPRSALAGPPTLDADVDLGPLPAMKTYFEGEEDAGAMFLGVGLTALGAGVGLAASGDESRTAFHAAWPTLTIGLVQSLAGVILLARSQGQIDERRGRIAANATEFVRVEGERMEGVHRDVTALIWIEVALVAVSAGLVAGGVAHDLDPMTGVGYGLGAQSIAMLLFDLAVSDRADRYRAGLAASR